MAFSRDQDLGNDDLDDNGAFSGVNFYREVLRDIYHSEELKVESKRSKQLASTIDRLCIAKPAIFFNLLEAVSKEIDVKKKELTGVNAKRRMHQASYMYQVERLPVVLRCLGKEEEGSMNDTILWQMIVDRLFEINNDTIEELQQSEPSRQLTIIEENAVYYAAGYIMQKLIKKYRQRSDEQSLDIMGALLNMVGLDIIGDMPEDSSSYIDYVKIWTNNNDRGGLRHVSNDTYRCFVAIEEIVYKNIIEGEPKDKVMVDVISDDNVKFLWEIATDLSDEKMHLSLLQEATKEWFILRGFSVTSQLLEQYKKATKKNIKGTKGIRKELH